MLGLICVSVCLSQTATAGFFQRDTSKTQATDTSKRLASDTTKPKPSDSLRFPIQDRWGDFLTNANRNPFNLKDPANIHDSIEYDPATRQYYIIEKIGDTYYRKPTYLTFDELMKLRAQQDEDDYFRQRADLLSLLNQKLLKPKFAVTDNLFNRLFGNGNVDIKPQGNVDITAGYQGQNVQNPTLPESARRTGGLDFNMDANINVLGNIGSKLKLPITYNTQATFDWMNQLKLDYTGGPEDIIKKIEAGNVSFTTKSTLMASEQSLFGIKTQLQFGKLYITAVLANQRSQSQSLGLQGGAATTPFQFKADDYDENRNFLLAQYFKNTFNYAMSNLPIVNSQVQILHLEIWVTNRNGTTAATQARQVVGLMDLGEATPYNPNIHSLTNLPYPDNNSNSEYAGIIGNPNSRSPDQATNVMNAQGLTQVQDFEIVYARKLDSSAYHIYPQLGFISLNQQLQPDDVLAVAYQYSYNGHIYQVGELSQDVPPDTSTSNYSGVQKILYLKLLKASAQRTALPIWQLMMKNIYTLKTASGGYLSNIQPAGFQLNILYDEPSKGNKRYLPAGDKVGVPLLSVLNLDRLDIHNDPGPDGMFDYLEGYTVNSAQARIIFPVLQPFGKDLDSLAFKNSQALAPNYVFYQLYDTIKVVAQTYANVDRYYLSGVAKGQSTTDISLGAFNVPQGSVVVTAGGQALKENVDYVVDYNLGTVKVINQAIINSGVPVNVQYENNASFGTQQRSFIGVRLDYLAKNTPTESLTIGGTLERLNERPFFTKTSYDEDPIRNTMYGADVNYKTTLPQVTRWLNRLPFYSTKEMSSLTAYGESAFLQPGHPPQIGSGSSGTIYIDDFEGSTSSIDMRFPLTSWALASVPQGNGLFPEGSLNDTLAYGYNRAKIAWYNIEPTLQDNTNGNNPVRSYQNQADPRIAAINVQQLFPQQTPEYGQAQLITFDVSYYPTDKGPYNFDARPGSVTNSGKLLNPTTRWGGIMRAIDQTDFETANIQYIEFWMQDPFNSYMNNQGSTGGSLYFDLGSVSEDILKDGKKMFENGLPTPNIPGALDTSVWGVVPLNSVQVTNAFSTNPADRPYQDVGFDGLDDDSERIQFQPYLTQLATNFGAGSPAYQSAFNDPSNDNFLNYRDPSYDAVSANILQRYKSVNNPQGNSPVATPGQTFVNAFTLYPDAEDLDHDNTMNELEEYFEYRVQLTPSDTMVGTNFITDRQSFFVNNVQQTWYQFRIPISSYTNQVGNIPDFKSIRFVRMYLTGFSDSVVLRFAELQFIRDSWRNFSYVLDTTGNYNPLPVNSPTTFNQTAVNIEQNSTRTPIPYVIPPGIQRQQQLSTNDVNILLNEQAMSLQICNLKQGDGRGVYKTVNLDLRKYGKMDMFIHAEGAGLMDTLNNYALSAVIRLGSDFVSNYYEIRIPLRKTIWHSTLATDIWPDSNNLNLSLNRLVQLKIDRNNQGNPGAYFFETDTTGRTYAILGNPNLGQIQAFFLGVENVHQASVCTEVWFDELRLSDINDQGGFAAVGRVDLKLADLGSLYLGGSYKTAGFGSIDQHINERSTDNTGELDAGASVEMGRLLPRKAGLSIPVYATMSQVRSTPEYDPFDLDIKLKDKLKQAPASERDSILAQAVNYTITKSLNFTDVHKNNTSGKPLKLWSIENFDLSFSVTRSDHHDSVTESAEQINYKGSLAYNFTRPAKFVEPFKRKIKSKSIWYSLIRDFNFNPMPSALGFRTDIARQFEAYRPRNIGGPKGVLPETYDKFFNFNRSYVLRWDLTRSLRVDFTANDNAVVDEDTGRLNSVGRRQMWRNFEKGGRNILYNQTANATYVLPTAKIPLLDWTQFRVGYGATYSWTAASLLAQTFGNTLQNTQQKSASAELDFSRLYAKTKWLRALEPPKGAGKTGTIASRSDSLRNRNLPPKPQEVLPELPKMVKFVGRIITSVKQITLNYSENSASTIYGYRDSTHLLGMDLRTGEPGWGYVFGKQPSKNFVEQLANRGLLSTDTNFNFQNSQSFNQLINLTGQIQPIPDLNINLNMTKTFGKTFSELFKDTTSSSGFVHLNPYVTGTFSISWISFRTLFTKYEPDQVTETFKKFEYNRYIISARLGAQNPYSQQLGPDGYYKGYGRYSQDVLIPAFIAAYTGKDPNLISLINESNSNIRTNPFAGYLPKPNWRITYNGLSRLPGFDKIFTNFSITHAYSSTLSMGSFNSNLNYQDPFGLGYAGFIDTTSGNFVPYFQVPSISINEQFSPLIDLEMQFVNQMQASISYSKGRQLALSLLDYQMSESRTSAFTVGLGYRKKNVNLPFGIRFGTPEGARNVSNDMTFHIDFSLRDDATSNSYLDQIASQPIGGQKVIDIAPSIDYVINSRINVKFYFDQRRVEPKISSSPPITTTKGGLTIRISLAEFAQAKAGAGVSAGATAPGPGPAPLTPTQPPNGNVPPVH
jgi:cell surface protein SprA